MSNLVRLIVITAAVLATLTTATATSASSTVRRWYWTERYTATQIWLTDGQDLYGREPAAIVRGGFISDPVTCTGLPNGIRRNGLRLYWHLSCSFRITETDPVTGDDVDSYWTGTVTTRGREDYLARWRRYA